MIQRNDALIGGLNCELTNNYTLQRRGGFPRYCAQTFAANEFPLAYFSARINGQVVSFVDTNLAVYTFTPSALKLLFTKSAGAGQTHFLQVGNIIYFANGVDNKKWAPPKTVWAAGTAFALGTLIIDTNGNIQQVTTAGTSGGSQPAWNTTPITGTTADGGTLVWTNRGNQVSNWGINAPASAPTASPTTAGNGACRFWWPNTAYTLGGGQYSIIDTNGNVQAIQAPGTSGANAPVWTTTPQTNVQDNTLSWGCVTAPGTWTPNTLIFATNGAVIDSNNNLQVAQTGGSTGAAAPAWNAAFNGTTVDNAVTWLNVGSAKFLAFRGYQWVFAYHTCYGHVSTASPITPSTGPIIGSSYSVPLSGPGSTDPQCDYVWLFRIRDGGSVFEFMGQVANPGAGTWNFTDNIIDANLEDQLIAAQDHLNDPPPAGMTVLSWHMKRPWGGVGNTMQFGIGPDKIIGVAEECWPPANEETFASNVQKLASTTQGLCILTSDQWWVEMGGPQTLSFWPQKILDNFGISSPNCLAQDGDQIFIYTTSKQLWSLSLGNGKEEDGFAVGDLLAAGFNSTTTYLTIHRNGTDVGVFLSDGSTNIFRYSLMLNCWSTLYQPAGGVGAIGSIETSFGTYSLLASRPVGGGAIMARSLTSFYDDIASATYPWNAQIGSVHLSQPGTPVQELDNIVIQTTNAGTELTLGVRINEIAGDFIPIPGTADDPFDLPPKTMRSRRHDLRDNQEAQPIQIRHMQLQISGVAEDAKSEVLGIHFCPQAA